MSYSVFIHKSSVVKLLNDLLSVMKILKLL